MRTAVVAISVCLILTTWGCGFLPGAPPTEPQVRIEGPASATIANADAAAADPYALVGPVAKGSFGVDRLAWPVQRLEVGGPTLPPHRAAFQSPTECAVTPDPDSYYTKADVLPALREIVRFPATLIVFPVLFWPKDAPRPELPPSPYAVPQR
jgi:hypothetical protein